MGKPAKNPVKSIHRSFEIIHLMRGGELVRVSDLVDQVNMSKSGIHNHLSTLQEEGYVIQENGMYRLSLKFLDIGGELRSRMPLYNVAPNELNQLAADTKELVNLATMEREKVVYLFRAKGDDAVDLDVHAGQETYLHSTSLGKAILAYLPRSTVEDIIEETGLPRNTENTITERDDLFAELERIQEQGYATDDEERLTGLRSVAAPVRTDENVIGAISVSGPTSRLQDKRFRNSLPEKVRSSANVIELSFKSP